MMIQDQKKRAIAMLFAVSEAIREAGEIPAGHLYAALMSRVTFDAFNAMIGTLTNAELIEEGPGNMLRWIGPEMSPTVAEYDKTPEVFTCQACGRPEADCSAVPCDAVMEEREACIQ